MRGLIVRIMRGGKSREAAVTENAANMTADKTDSTDKDDNKEARA